MKFLKKFNTEEEYEAYLNSDDFVRPCVARIVDDKAVRYKKRYKSGVYVQHINGELFTAEQWVANGYADNFANGVAVVANEAKFVIAKSDIEASPMAWSPKPTTNFGGVLTSDTQAVAISDYGGWENTISMASQASNGAANHCIGYVFPNGRNGGYMPALGEWNIAYQNKKAIDATMAIIGGTAIVSGYYWSSTQVYANNAWCINWNDGGRYSFSKDGNRCVRSFLELTL